MEVPLQSIVSPALGAHGHGRPQTKPRTSTNKTSISQKITTLKGIIRIPTRRSSTKDDISVTSPSDIGAAAAVHPMQQHQRSKSTATDSSLGSPARQKKTKNDPYKLRGVKIKPYMSQPTLGAGEYDDDDDEEDGMFFDRSRSGSGSGSGSSPDHDDPFARAPPPAPQKDRGCLGVDDDNNTSMQSHGDVLQPVPSPLSPAGGGGDTITESSRVPLSTHFSPTTTTSSSSSMPASPPPPPLPEKSISHTTPAPPHPQAQPLTPPTTAAAVAGSRPTTPGRPHTPSNSKHQQHGKKFSISSGLFNGTRAGLGAIGLGIAPNSISKSSSTTVLASAPLVNGQMQRQSHDNDDDRVIDIAPPPPALDSAAAMRSTAGQRYGVHRRQRHEGGKGFFGVGNQEVEVEDEDDHSDNYVDGDDDNGDEEDTINATKASKPTAPVRLQPTLVAPPMEGTSSSTSSSRLHHARAPSRDLPPLPPLSPLTASAFSSASFDATAAVGQKDAQDVVSIVPTSTGLGVDGAHSRAKSNFKDNESYSGSEIGNGFSAPLITPPTPAGGGATTATDDQPEGVTPTSTITTATATTATKPRPLPSPSVLRMSVSADPASSSATSSNRHLSYPASASSSSTHPTIHPFPSPPILTLTTSDGPGLLSSSSSSNNNLSRSASAAAPKLKRPPPNHRFSLTFSSSTSSMPGGVPILPLPVVPVFQNVTPGLGGGGGGGGLAGKGNDNSRAKKRLSGMPALHLQGTSRGARGHEEFDEEDEEGDEEDEDEDGEESQESGLLDVGDDDGALSRSSFSSDMSMSSDGYSNSMSHSTMATLGSGATLTSSSRDHGQDEDKDDDDDGTRSVASRTSSYKTALVEQPSAPGSASPSPLPSPGPSHLEPYFGDLTRPPDKRFSRTPQLPAVETGKLELDFSFLDKPPPADVLGKFGGIGGKGKGKASNRFTMGGGGLDRLTEDAGRTPVGKRASTPWASGSSRVAAANANAQADYFAQNHQYQQQQPNQNVRDGRSISEKTVRATRNVSPARTPRAEDYYQAMNAPTPTIGSRGYDSGLPPNTMPPLPQRTAEARLSSQLSISRHPGMYRHASRSLIDVHAVEKKEKVEQMVREDEEAEEEDRKRRVKALRTSMKAAVQGTPYKQSNGYLAVGPGVRAQELGSSAIAPSRTGVDDGQDDNKLGDPGRNPPHSADAVMSGGGEVAANAENCSASGVIGQGEGKDVGAGVGTTGMNKRISMAPPYDALSHPLRKRRSMPTFTATTAPPPYPDFAPHPGSGLGNIRILPREDEGREQLPPYTNDIKLMAIMPRKLEFMRPGIQAKDRKWRRVLCVLEGTVLKVYKAPSGASGVSAIGEWWESKVGVGDVALAAPTTTTSFRTSSVASGSSQRLSGTNPGDFTTGSGEQGVRAAIAAVEQAEREEELTRERELVRARKNGEVEAAVQLQTANLSDPDSPVQDYVQPSPPALHVQGHHLDHASHEGQLGGGGLIPATKSALNLAVQLLKPGGSSRHGRSSSDVGSSPTRPRSPRSSLNIPRSGRTTPTSSLRSRSPTPSPSVINNSRPSTPATSISMGSTSHSHSQSASSSRSGFRVGAGSMASSSTRSSNARQGHSRVNVGLTPREKEKEKEKALEPQESDLIKAYTMQNAESGLGSDYLKRKHVIRVRLEGEQFLLQAKDVDSVIAWIEGLQSATNIALDLDERPMPRGPIFPRRRRRRRVQPPSINTNTANIPPTNPSPTGQTPVTASHLAAPLTRSARRR